MKTFNRWMTMFGELSPLRQILLLLGLGCILANCLAALFFEMGGYDSLDKTILATTLIVIVVGGPLGAFLVGLNYRLKVMAHELDIAFRKDGMTGLSTRHEFYLRVEQMILRNNPALSAGAVLYIDADHFKSVNDSFGHAVGDDVLQEMGSLIGKRLGRRDVGARFGGEEFAVFLADADYGKAAWVAHGILLDMRGISPKVGPKELSLTVSIGVSFHEPGQTLEELVNAADECLYRAKN
ncbi:GGDEF domain-containing protein [Phyllobacterium sp. LjRoot231]|uniref:GGDEF domain-containing protein n=1 Tax=Phyllobacterium sp. LjRoot231 TaxID=3342289 RepID=UPI003ECD9107